MMILVFTVLAPLVVAAVIAFMGRTCGGIRLLPLGALPALLYSVFGDAEGSRELGWVILESRLGLSYSGPAFLFFTALLWGIAGWFAAGYFERDRAARRFAVFWLLALCGNIGLVLAGDVLTFYSCFALLTFAAYGLVVHTRSAEAWRAGLVYIVMAVGAEALLLSGLLLAVAEADSYLLRDVAAAAAVSPHGNWIIGLILAGFGVKAGMVPLHFWLPLAHPVAPSPASAVLSGAMIKSGLLGWMHLLPGGHGEFPLWSIAIVCLGVAGAFYAVACGLPQRDPKTVLAYSSVSQMGVMMVAVGAGLANPGAWEATYAVLVVYALNHGVSKGALFMGAGICARRSGAGKLERHWILAGLALPALAIAGAPLMGGAIAKYALKGAAEQGPPLLAPWLAVLLPLSAVATTVLLGRFLILVKSQLLDGDGAIEARSGDRVLVASWVAATMASAAAVYFTIPWFALELRTAEPGLAGIWESLWPILVGAVLLAVLVALRRDSGVNASIPSGDIVAPVTGFLRLIAEKAGHLTGPERWRIDWVPMFERGARHPAVQVFLAKGEMFLRKREVTGLLILSLLFVLFWLL